jgi:lysyl-tRNA synthetase class 2
MESIKNARLKKIAEISGAGKEPFAYSFRKTHSSSDLHELYKALSPGASDVSNRIVRFAGRIMIRRVFGKLAFFEMQDEVGKIQLYIDQKRLGKDQFKRIKDWTDSGMR